MKEAVIKFGDREFKIDCDFEQEYNRVVIYELRNDTPLPIYMGRDLKSACKKWSRDIEDISVVVESFELWAEDQGIDLQAMDFMEVGKYYEQYIDSLDGEELFILLIPSENYNYIDWSKIDEVM